MLSLLPWRQRVFVLSCALAALGSCDQGPRRIPAAATAAEPENVLLEGWQAETFSLPPSFAPNLPTGMESLRFAPGWRDPTAEGFWSYAFVMWINEPAPNAVRIEALLKNYYDGLLATFAAGAKKDISGTPARVEVAHAAPGRFEATMHLVDAFATFKPITVRVSITAVTENPDRTALHIRVSPQPEDHAIWRSLDAAIADILAKGEPAAPLPADPANPLADFSRLTGGEWKTTFGNGSSAYEVWQYGPGNFSMRRVSAEPVAGGDTWAGDVLYWHPGRKQIRVLNVHEDIPGVGRGAGEGPFAFNGEIAAGDQDLYQPRGTRKMGSRWVFDGPDKYRNTLLENTGSGLQPMNGWTFARIPKRTETRPAEATTPRTVAEPFKAFVPLLGRTWNAKGAWAGEPFHIETTIELAPHADAVVARSVALRSNGSPIHFLDAYIYVHPGTGRLRSLAIWSRESGGGGVYEGDLAVLDGGALQLDLTGYEGDAVAQSTLRFDIETDGRLRTRLWPADSDSGPPVVDVHHSSSAMSQSLPVVFHGSKGHFWFGSNVEGVYRSDGKSITHFSCRDGLPSNGVRGIQEDKAGNIYFTTSGGIAVFNGETIRALVPVKAAAPGEGWRLDPDDLWFPGGQNIGEVYRYDGTTLHALSFPRTELGNAHFAQYPRSEFPAMKYSPYDVYSIFKDSRGHLWFGTNTGFGMLGVCRYDGTSFSWISSDEMGFGGSGYCVRSTIEDRDGRFWFSNTRHRYSVRPTDAGESLPHTKEPGIRGWSEGFPYFMSSVKDQNGDLWLATFSAGVWKYDGTSMTHYPVKDGEEDATLFSITMDKHGVLWLGSQQSGAYKFNGTTFEKFRP